MATEYRDISARLPSQYERGGRIVNDLVDSLVTQDMLPHALNKGQVFIPEIPLKPLWERQVARLIELGFNKFLKMSEEEYKASIPYFPPQPNEYFDIPAVVETRVPFSEQTKLLQFRGGEFEVFDIIDVPTKPYTSWFHIAIYSVSADEPYYRVLPHIPLEEAISKIRMDERKGILNELINTVIHFPSSCQGGSKMPANLFALGSRTLLNAEVPYIYDHKYVYSISTNKPVNYGYIGGILTRSPLINIAA